MTTANKGKIRYPLKKNPVYMVSQYYICRHFNCKL